MMNYAGSQPFAVNVPPAYQQHQNMLKNSSHNTYIGQKRALRDLLGPNHPNYYPNNASYQESNTQQIYPSNTNYYHQHNEYHQYAPNYSLPKRQRTAAVEPCCTCRNYQYQSAPTQNVMCVNRYRYNQYNPYSTNSNSNHNKNTVNNRSGTSNAFNEPPSVNTISPISPAASTISSRLLPQHQHHIHGVSDNASEGIIKTDKYSDPQNMCAQQMEITNAQNIRSSLPSLTDIPSIISNEDDNDHVNYFTNSMDNDHVNYFPDFCNIQNISNISASPPVPAPCIKNEVDKKILFEANSVAMSRKSNAATDAVQSASCHQCKTKKDVAILFYCTKKRPCTNSAYKSKVIKCRKKYCVSCMKKYFQDADVEQFKQFKDSRSWSFDCPSCQNVCSCRACRRKREKEKSVTST